MKSLWAPWRLPYLVAAGQEARRRAKTGGGVACVFCEAWRSRRDKSSLVLHAGRRAFVILNKYPYSNGHLMVIPTRHGDDFIRLSGEEHAEASALIALSLKAMGKYVRCHGFNIGMNLGESAGAGIEGHLHWHIVPRWRGDHNFMPVLAATRVIPEHLAQTAAKLRVLFAALA